MPQVSAQAPQDNQTYSPDVIRGELKTLLGIFRGTSPDTRQPIIVRGTDELSFPDFVSSVQAVLGEGVPIQASPAFGRVTFAGTSSQVLDLAQAPWVMIVGLHG